MKGPKKRESLGCHRDGGVNNYFLANVRDDGSPLAFGMTPAREAENAGGMPKVPKAW